MGLKRMFKKHRPPAGSRPGTLSVSMSAIAPRVRVYEYSEKEAHEYEVSEWEELGRFRNSKSLVWIHVQGLADVDFIRHTGELFGLHPLVLEDVVNIPQRPKSEDHGEYIFIVTTMANMSKTPDVETEQISVFFGANFVITFEEKYTDLFDPIVDAIRHSKGQIRKGGPDFLAHALVDTIIDAYYPILERLGEYVEELEERIIEHPSKDLLPQIYEFRREMLTLRRAIYPQRELLSPLIRDPSKLIRKPTQINLRDCHDHCVQIIDVLETYREICSGLMDVYLSGLSHKMNEIMKVLTMIATIFIPLSFIAGVYGMNFDTMPELRWKWWYPAVLLGMLMIGLGMLWYFFRAGWIEFGKPENRKRRAR